METNPDLLGQYQSPEDKKRKEEMAMAVVSFPEKFIICEGCGSLFGKGGTTARTGVCPVCKAYRFSDDRQRVKDQAYRVASEPRSSVLPSDYS